MLSETEVKLVDTSWMVQGRCRDLPPEVFFPSDGVGVEVARHYCAECPVKGPCLEYALENHIEHGVWGGASERERRRIARSRRGLPARSGLPQPVAPSRPSV
jgi:WhiB family redox-sensing transcriptional regulator